VRRTPPGDPIQRSKPSDGARRIRRGPPRPRLVNLVALTKRLASPRLLLRSGSLAPSRGSNEFTSPVLSSAEARRRPRVSNDATHLLHPHVQRRPPCAAGEVTLRRFRGGKLRRWSSCGAGDRFRASRQSSSCGRAGPCLRGQFFGEQNKHRPDEPDGVTASLKLSSSSPSPRRWRAAARR